MLKKGDLRFVGLVMGAVIGAGFVMKALKDVPVIADARDGYNA